MKKYKVTVNGTAYQVELEEVVGDFAPMAAPVAAPAPAAAPAASGAAGDNKVTAPMPGTILRINKQVGDAVKEGDVLMILEAMKMENEIMCPCDGKVASVNTTVGAAVEPGTLLCTIG